jgi:hypothetical protein
MNLMDRIEEVKKMWATMLPHIAQPDPAWIGRWCEYSDRVIEHAVVRASKKFALAKTDGRLRPEIAWRYVTGVIANEGRQTNGRTMNANELRQLWEQTFKVVPDDDLFTLMAEYTARSDENEKTLLWLLMKSSTQIFASETDRALWIANQVKAFNDDGNLPAFSDPMKAA